MPSPQPFNFWQRIMLQHAYLPKLVLDCVGVTLGAYFLWHQDLFISLIIIFGCSLLGNVIAWKQDLHQLSKTSLGKWMLAQATTFNLIVRSVGAVVAAYGLYTHQLIAVFAGVALIIFARLGSNWFKS